MRHAGGGSSGAGAEIRPSFLVYRVDRNGFGHCDEQRRFCPKSQSPGRDVKEGFGCANVNELKE